MKRLEIDGCVITIEGTWCEVSRHREVVAYGSVDPNTTPEQVYEKIKDSFYDKPDAE